MANEILYTRICKLIAMNYALNADDVIRCFENVGSIDEVLKLARKDEIK